jgi:hypothetical protein
MCLLPNMAQAQAAYAYVTVHMFLERSLVLASSK